MCKCEGGTKSNPCTKEAKYLLEWVIENVNLCAEHFDQEDNAKILREQIAGEIEKMLNKYPDNSFQDGFNHALTLSAEIARG